MIQNGVFSHPPDKQTSTLRGTVVRVTFRNPTNGYSVVQVDADDSKERITAVGLLPLAKVGSHVLMEGEFVTHQKFGRQFSAVSCTEAPPSTAEGISRYLASGIITGVGKITADRIVAAFGERAIEKIKESPDEVALVPGVGKKKAQLLQDAFAAQTEFDQTMRFLIEHKIGPSLGARIYERFKNKAVEIISKDPYVLAREIRGIGFLTADSIAKTLGFPHDSPLRLKAGLAYALDQAADEGHCALTEENLIGKASQLLEIENPDSLRDPLHELMTEGLLVRRGSHVLLKRIDRAEEFVSDFVRSRHGRSADPLFSPARLETALHDAEKALSITLSAEQRDAVESVCWHRLALITGGPGCGKTTLIKALTTLFELEGIPFALAAPTGRAAQRMAQVCSTSASTIHRLLKFDPFGSQFVHNSKNPLPFRAIIIDETSMVDISLARDLFSAIAQDCSVVLVGDKDQLPSVGPGRVFGDLVESDKVRVCVLSQLFRRAEESRINVIAHGINHGHVPAIPSIDDGTPSDAFFISRASADESVQAVERLVSEYIPQRFGFTGSDIAVLTPANRGPIGTQELNRRLQEKLNPVENLLSGDTLTFEWGQLRVGDRVCQRVNNYKIDPSGVFNGDMGTITSLDKDEGTVTVDLWDGRVINYTRSEVHQLSLAYSLTVHRSQGMEVPCVVLALDNSHYTLLERQLLYTAVTRAKKLLIIVGSKRALGMASKRATTRQRATLLGQRISGVEASEPEQLFMGDDMFEYVQVND